MRLTHPAPAASQGSGRACAAPARPRAGRPHPLGLAPAPAVERRLRSRQLPLVQATEQQDAINIEGLGAMVIPWDASRETWDEESAARMATLMRRFEAADKDGNGVIDREELRALLERVGGGDDEVPLRWLSDDDIGAVLEQYDTNGDGVISFDEFTRMCQDNIFLAGKLEEYRAAFRAVDEGGNGSISATELYQLFQRLDQPISYEKLVKIMEGYDLDQSGVIEFGEFLRMFRSELLDLADIVAYIKRRTASREAKASAASAARAVSAAKSNAAAAAAPRAAGTLGGPGAAEAPVPGGGKLVPGGVTMFFSEDEFDTILRAHPDRLIVVMASVTWCKPCRAFQDKYEAAAAHYRDAIFLKFYGNSNESTKALFKEQLKARTTPSFFFFKGGQIVGRCTGAKAGRLETHLREAYAPEGPTVPMLWAPESSPESSGSGSGSDSAA